MKRTQTLYFPNDIAKCLRDSGGDKKMEFHCSVNEVVNVSRSANLLKRQVILRAAVGKATASLGICVRPPNCPHVQGGSNMTGTDMCVNKPHCAAAVRP